jgi:hypothetical protein
MDLNSDRLEVKSCNPHFSTCCLYTTLSPQEGWWFHKVHLRNSQNEDNRVAVLGQSETAYLRKLLQNLSMFRSAGSAEDYMRLCDQTIESKLGQIRRENESKELTDSVFISRNSTPSIGSFVLSAISAREIVRSSEGRL